MEGDGKPSELKEKLPIKRSKGSLGSLNMITGKNNELGKTSGTSANGVYSKRYDISYWYIGYWLCFQFMMVWLPYLLAFNFFYDWGLGYRGYNKLSPQKGFSGRPCFLLWLFLSVPINNKKL